MKKFKITKEQILQLNSYNNYDCGVALRQWFPKAFETELEVGKWYTVENGCLFFLEKITDDWFKGYGFTSAKNYYNDFQEYKSKKLTIATDQEVETALINEAKKRGFKDGNYKCLDFPTLTIKNCNIYEYSAYKNRLFLSSKGIYCNLIFNNGKWAEIISETIELTLEQIAEKFNVSVEQIKIKK